MGKRFLAIVILIIFLISCAPKAAKKAVEEPQTAEEYADSIEMDVNALEELDDSDLNELESLDKDLEDLESLEMG